MPLVVAHRGASRSEAENTLPAFEAAVAAGAQAVEFDVRLCADGHPVVIHDPDTVRVCGEGGLICAMTLSEVKRLKLRTSTGEPAEIPTLTETLALLSGRIGVDIEIKNVPGEPDYDPQGSEAVGAIVRVLDGTAFSGPVLLSSFDPALLVRVRDVYPELPTGLLSPDAVPAVVASQVALKEGHGWVLPSVSAMGSAGQGFLQGAHGSGLLVGTWVVDDVEVAREMIGWGIDAIATNDPASMVAVRAEPR